MDENNYILKIKSDILGTIIVLIIILYVLYLFRIWNWKAFIESAQIYWLGGWLCILYLYGQYRTTVYYLYEEKLIIKFPFRPFYNMFEFQIEDIESIKFYDVNTLSVFSSIVIYSQNKKRVKYRFAYTNLSYKMKKLLHILENKGIKVEILNISGDGIEPK